MFAGRRQELDKLNRLYKTKGFQFAVVYGRRRVGKTALINEFIKNKQAIFFTGIESSGQQNLENLSKSIIFYADKLLDDTVFSSLQSAVEYVFKIAEKKRIILVIDEYPYIAKADKSFASMLQALIDKNKDTSELFLILCGSSMSFMENQVLAYKAPLYGRRTAQFKILPFDFFESRSYFKNFSDNDMAVIYGIVGGTPQYLLQMKDSLSLEENIKQTFLDPASPLFEEPNNLLKQEVREAALYNAIITAIATGSTKLSQISAKTGEETGACSSYIKNLISLGILKKETPIGEKPGKKTIYKIEDNLFRFWYRFVPGNIAPIHRGLADIVYNKIEPLINDYMGAVFEEICTQYLWKLLERDESEIEFTDLGRWWGNVSENKCEAEIDIMGTDGKSKAILAECKWRNEKTDVTVLDSLADKRRLFHYDKVKLYLFSKTGFTKGCIQKAKEMGNVTLLSYEDMIKIIDKI